MIFSSKHTLLKKLNELGFDPDKIKGQNYLIDTDVCDQFVRDNPLDPENDVILEIGPGLGAYSDYLAEHSKQYYLIELESMCARFLEDHFKTKFLTQRVKGKQILAQNNIPSEGKVIILEGDALKIPFPSVRKVFSSVPYSICYELVLKILQSWEYDFAHLIVQWEFAERLIAQTGDHGYNVLAAFLNFYAKCTLIRKIPEEAFYPVPEVTSVVVTITPKDTIQKDRKERRMQSQFLAFLRGLFIEMTWTLERATEECWKKKPQFSQMFPNFKSIDKSKHQSIQLRKIPPEVFFDYMIESLPRKQREGYYSS
jgi:16S rRNA (adenine1518-N6/adenine1519-N6)-dimethyltransferase